MGIVTGRSRGAWLALTVGILGSACGKPEPAGSLAITPTAFRLAHAESTKVRLTWTPSRRLTEKTASPTVFVHLIHPTAKTVRTFDHRLPGGQWEPDVPITYELEIAESGLAEPLPEGSYGLAIGLYDEASGYRWPLLADGEDADRRAYRVATVEVAGPRVPDRFQFTGAWRAVEPGTTKQIVAWRWLQSGGTVRTYAAGGTVQLRFQLGSLPENAGGAAATSVALDGDCLLSPAIVEGPGAVERSLPVRQGSPGEPCSIHLHPEAGGAGAWARLDGIDWRPPAG
jgi:hypothetical protein